jgi:hypothetical protein
MTRFPAWASLILSCCVVSGCGREQRGAPPPPAVPASTAAPTNAPEPKSDGYAEPPPPAAADERAAPVPRSPAPSRAAPTGGGPSSTAKRRRAELNAEEESFDSVEQAEAALAQARAELDQAWADLGRGAASGAPAQAPAGAAHDDRETKPSAKADNRCGNACRAFDSLDRAATAVCRLAGEATDRCSRAKRIRTESSQRVSACGCALRAH